MDFLDMTFSKLFLDKHGENIYSNICNEIKNEAPDVYNEKYLETVFKVAFLSYFGLKDNQIKALLKNMKKIDSIDVSMIQNAHKKSISIIQEYLENTSKSVLEDEK